MSKVSPTVIEITRNSPNYDALLDEMTLLISLAFTSRCDPLQTNMQLMLADPLDPMTIPAVGVTYEGNPKLHHDFHRVELEAAFTGAGRVFGAFVNTDGTERLAGAAIWYEPGHQFLDDEEQLGYWVPFSNKLNPDTRQWWEEVMLPRYGQLTTEGLGEGVKKGLFHLQMLAVHPDYHRRGVGKALVQYTLAQSDSQGIASCVETTKETNVLFYVGLGFEVKSEKEIPSPHGDFNFWCLKRELNSGKKLASN